MRNKLLFVGKLENWLAIETAISEKFPIVKFPHYTGNAVITRGKDWLKLLEINTPINGNPIPNPESLWSILFTSKTTGTPKGTMIKHGAFVKLLESEEKHNYLGIMEIKNPRFLFVFTAKPYCRAHGC